MSEPVLLTAEEAATALRLSRATVYKLLKSGQLRSVLIGRARRVHQEDVDAFARAAVAAGSVVVESSRPVTIEDAIDRGVDVDDAAQFVQLMNDAGARVYEQ